MEPPVVFRPHQTAYVVFEDDLQTQDGLWAVVERTHSNPVHILAIVEGYAMVRHKGLRPFVVPLKALRADPQTDGA